MSSSSAASGVHGRPGGPPLQLLEITLISAQDLAPVAKSLETYAVAWINPDRRLTTSVDRNGHTNPSWNDKFVFRVDEAFLAAATSVVNVEIFAVSWLRDVRLGAARFLVSCLVPAAAGISSQVQSSPQGGGSNMRFVALQIRRPSGRPQGILNVGAAILDRTMRSMPLYTELSASAVGYRQLIKDMGIRKSKRKKPQHNKNKNNSNAHLRRAHSERNTPTNTVNMIASHHVADDPPNSNDGSVRDSDVCPSPLAATAGAESSKPEEWEAKSSREEGLETKLERWRKGMPQDNNNNNSNNNSNNNNNHGGKEDGRRRHPRRHTDRGGLFSCFANGYGCEFSIKCGGKNPNKNKPGSNKFPLKPDSLLDDTSRSHI